MEACRRTIPAAAAPHPADRTIDTPSARIEQAHGLSEENGELPESPWPGTRWRAARRPDGGGRPDVQRLLEAFRSTAAVGVDNDRGSGGGGALIRRATLDG